jgi:hypothetical protein
MDNDELRYSSRTIFFLLSSDAIRPCVASAGVDTPLAEKIGKIHAACNS